MKGGGFSYPSELERQASRAVAEEISVIGGETSYEVACSQSRMERSQIPRECYAYFDIHARHELDKRIDSGDTE